MGLAAQLSVSPKIVIAYSIWHSRYRAHLCAWLMHFFTLASSNKKTRREVNFNLG